MARARSGTIDRRSEATAPRRPTTTTTTTTDGATESVSLTALQSSAGNRALAGALAPGPAVQRLWDTTAAQKANPTGFASLLAKMQGLTPTIGRSRLDKLAAKTDSAPQLEFILSRINVATAERALAAMSGATLHRFVSLAPNPTAFGTALNDVLRLSIDLAPLFAGPTPATFTSITDLINTTKSNQGLISAKGTEIAFSSVTAVSGDGKADEKTAVKNAVASLDAGTLPGVPHGNRDGDLPGIRRAGGYTEHDVAPPPGVTTRGERRLVVSDAKKFVYYTWNHYGKDGTVLPAFIRIR
jgi:hypothetical protein